MKNDLKNCRKEIINKMDRYIPLSNEILILTYEKAMKLELPKEFIEMLREEVEKRQLLIK